MAPNYDPIAVEIHRKALENVTQEMALTLERTSGSPVVTDAQDFCTCLLDKDGEPLSMAAYVLLHAAASMIGTQTLVKQLREEGVEPQVGDGWVVSDPYYGGALHQADIGIITPTFHGGELVGWAYANIHVLDVGGVGVSGFAPGARSVFEEGLRFPLIKMINGGVLDSQWEKYIKDNVRVPDLVINDVRSMIAANHVAQEKLTEVIDRFGLERHLEYCAISCDLTEQVMRRRIGALPDGVYPSLDWTEFDGFGEWEMLAIKCELEVAGDELIFRFSGDSRPDAPVNTGVAGAYGALITMLLTTLSYGDVPYNAGIWRPLTIDLGEPGSIVNAQSPSPMSLSHGPTANRIARCAKDALNQALSLSEDDELRGRVAGAANELPSLAGLFGLDQRGQPAVIFLFDPAVTLGGGALAHRDGMDFYALNSQPAFGVLDVEVHEYNYPVVFHWRRQTPNSGGPGQWRGGLGADTAFELRYADRVQGFVCTMASEQPSPGVGGGNPSSLSGIVAWRPEDRDGSAAPVDGELQGRFEQPQNYDGSFAVNRGDVVHMFGGGGTGLGDPLLRDPKLVARDVRCGYVTATHASAVYGVVLNGDREPDEAATGQARDEIRRERIGRDPEAPLNPPSSGGVSIVVAEDQGRKAWACGHCGSALADLGEEWRTSEAVCRHEQPIADRYRELEMQTRERSAPPVVTVRQFHCSNCAASLRVEAAPEGAEFSAPRLAAASAQPEAVGVSGASAQR